jgi:hypothetical protein
VLAPVAVVRFERGWWRASVTVGRVTLTASRRTEDGAVAALAAFFEDELFGCDRSHARALRAAGLMGGGTPRDGDGHAGKSG